MGDCKIERWMDVFKRETHLTLKLPLHHRRDKQTNMMIKVEIKDRPPKPTRSKKLRKWLSRFPKSERAMAITHYERRRLYDTSKARAWLSANGTSKVRAWLQAEEIETLKDGLIKYILQSRALHITKNKFVSLGGRDYTDFAGNFPRLWRRNYGKDMERIRIYAAVGQICIRVGEEKGAEVKHFTDVEEAYSWVCRLRDETSTTPIPERLYNVQAMGPYTMAWH